MATIIKRKRKKGNTFTAFVRRKGFQTFTKTFHARQDAIKWGTHMERNLDRGLSTDFNEASKYMMRDILKRYLNEEKGKHKKGWDEEVYRANKMMRDPICDLNLLQLSSKDIAEYKDRRLKEVSPTTFNKDLSFLKVAVDIAIFDWGINIPFNPCRNVKRLKQPRPRNRRLEGDEQTRLFNTIVSDISPRLTGQYDRDQAISLELVAMVFDFTLPLLVPGGSFVTKIFQGTGIEGVVNAAKQRFSRVQRFSPEASRNSSSEVFLVCKNKLPQPKKGSRGTSVAQELNSHLESAGIIQQKDPEVLDTVKSGFRRIPKKE